MHVMKACGFLKGSACFLYVEEDTMKTLYIDCGMGAAGDMLTAALLELMPDPEEAVRELNALQIPGVEYRAETAFKCGIKGTHMRVLVNGEEETEHMHDHHDHEHHHEHHHDHEHNHDHDEHGHHHHHHSGMAGIRHIVQDHTHLPEQIKQDVLNVYGILADAESAVHGMTVEEIHFHEVGTMDAVADIAAVCWLMDRIHPDQVIVSPVHVGSGTVHCAHGILPVPAPATANILKGIPVYSRPDIVGELCTPTGAALLKYFADGFAEMPVIRTEAIGYGMGRKDFTIANCVRTVLGETGALNDEIIELSCNVDDMTGEEIGYVFSTLMDAGARDVVTVPIGMKKNRPGTLINIVCRKEDRENILHILFRDTTTIGVRETIKKRYTLDRRVETIDTAYGPVRLKRSSGYGVQKQKYEYDDLAAAAEKSGQSVRAVIESIEKGKH